VNQSSADQMEGSVQNALASVQFNSFGYSPNDFALQHLQQNNHQFVAHDIMSETRKM
jgi:hypothetical protein